MKKLLALLVGILLASPVYAQQVNVLPRITSADNIAAQTATFMHGGMMAWDPGGGNWDRVLITSGSLNVNVTNTVPISGTVTADTELPVAAALSDAASNPSVPGIGAYALLYDSSGGVWNRQRSAIAGLNSVGAGMASVAGGCQFDDTTPTTVTENNFGNVRCSANRNVYIAIRDAAGNERGVNVTAGNALVVDGSAVTQPVNVAQINGATAQVASNGLNTTGSGLAATAMVGQCDDTTPTAITENQFGHARINCTTHHQLVEVGAALPTGSNTIGAVTGTLADDGAAAATNRVGTLPAIAQSGYNTSTAGRNTAHNTVAGSGLMMSASLPEPGLPSYTASAVVASAASATDIAVLPGNATNTVLVTEVRVSCTQTTAGQVELHLIKRSTADTAGTSAGMTEIPDDSNYAAASSAALTYTANPTTGTAVGDLDIVKLGCMATGTAAPNDVYIANFRQKPIVLRGTAQQLAINLNGATVSGGSFAVTYKWMEVTGL